MRTTTRTPAAGCAAIAQCTPHYSASRRASSLSDSATIYSFAMLHAAVVHARYLDLMARGLKQVESRLSIHRALPFGRVAPGHKVYFKAPGEPCRLRATVRNVTSYEHLTPGDLRVLRAQWGALVCAEPSYWNERRRSRFATFIELCEVGPLETPLELPGFYGGSWRILTPCPRATPDRSAAHKTTDDAHEHAR